MRAAAMLAGLVLLAAPAAWAGNSGAADDELEFGAITTFAAEAEAKASCGKDIVIWADRHAGYFFFAREPQYGRTSQGAFACLKDAKRANYWSTGPMGGIANGHGPGRVFPDHFPPPPTS